LQSPAAYGSGAGLAVVGLGPSDVVGEFRTRDVVVAGIFGSHEVLGNTVYAQFISPGLLGLSVGTGVPSQRQCCDVPGTAFMALQASTPPWPGLSVGRCEVVIKFNVLLGSAVYIQLALVAPELAGSVEYVEFEQRHQLVGLTHGAPLAMQRGVSIGVTWLEAEIEISVGLPVLKAGMDSVVLLPVCFGGAKALVPSAMVGQPPTPAHPEVVVVVVLPVTEQPD